MIDSLETLRAKMQSAADAMDFEEARRLRDMIALVSGGASPDEVNAAGGAGISRQRPGAMGLGTGQPRMEPPPGWEPPPKPDPRTTGPSRRRRK
ncbi:hypothetical protein GCM10011515_06660 [Tsuneonella deserti]|uniref:UVR domain-containing protein n=1 Tax=Tsuneonella deserti TaxID=2035528 RepID=A0ABQ1S1Q7_9SPHN|nr:UvrB/UvrC motif-containing protein [Tsuneonella deserti]GGD89726.1 hypothetical protein GCM10011515_06660 [Tsuneonella deserti]